MVFRTLFTLRVSTFRSFLPLLAFCALSLHGATNEPVSLDFRTNAIDPASMIPTKQEKDSRLGWWRDAKFGMFIHWGVYSQLEGAWHGNKCPGYAEHIQRIFKIPQETYRKEAAEQFNPVKFDADQWVADAKKAGMGYIVITAKHHDGFAMYDSKVSDWNIVKATPFHRDPMKELREACRRQGMRFGFYYSHAFDWGEKEGVGNDWEWNNPGGDKLLGGAHWWTTNHAFISTAHRYVSNKAIPQIEELIRNYDPDILWFDTPHKLPPWENLRILQAVRKAKPTLVVNGRLINGLGDYVTTCDCPFEFPPQAGDWEAIPTTNHSYGYSRFDLSHKPVGFFLRLLAKAAARGGNLLLNIGPMGDGRMDSKDLAILSGLADWWKVNGISIRGTMASPLPVQQWGESTLKGNTLYLHVFDWPRNGLLPVWGLKTEVIKAFLLADPAKPLEFTKEGSTLSIKVPATAPDTNDAVVALECAGEPKGDPSSRLLYNEGHPILLRTFDSEIKGGLRDEIGNERSQGVTNWKTKESAVTWNVHLREPGTYAVSIQYEAPKAKPKQTLKEGDAGKELVAADKGAGGTFAVEAGGQILRGNVTQETHPGDVIDAPLGKITLPAGPQAIRIVTDEITGSELFAPRSIILTPIGG